MTAHEKKDAIRSGEWWWLSCERLTVGVRLEDGLVAEGAPIVRKFIGQPSKNLGRWMRSLGGFEAVRLV